MKIGDKVRFLSEVGGGKVAGFQGKNIVLVEDEDGFQVPMRLTEVVVVGDENYDTRHVVESKATSVKAALAADDEEEESEPADKPVTFKAKPEERKGGDKLAWQVRAEGEIEPNTKEFIEEFGREDLNEFEHCCIQFIAYKRDKHFLLKPPVNADVRMDPVKFYKLHAFRENPFFEQPALIYTLIENDIQKVKL